MIFRVVALVAVTVGLLLNVPVLAAEKATGSTTSNSSLQRTLAPQASGATHENVRSQIAGQPMRAAVQPATVSPAKPSWWSKLGDNSKTAWTKTKRIFTPSAGPATKKESRFTMVGQTDAPTPPRTKPKTSWWQFGKQPPSNK